MLHEQDFDNIENMIFQNQIIHQQDWMFDHLHEDEDIFITLLSRLATGSEKMLPDAIEATKDELKKVFDKTGTIGEPVEEDSLPIGTEITDLGNILTLKDIETNPEWKARVIYRGDKPRVVIGKDPNTGRNIYKPVAENQDCWSCTTADHSAVRLVLAFALLKNCDTYTCDLQSAYLQAEAGGRDSFVKIRSPDMLAALPEEMKKLAKDLRNPIFRLRKALYGRTRSGYDWAEKLKIVLEEMDFQRCSTLSGLFCRKLTKDNKSVVDSVIAFYVDDCIVCITTDKVDQFFKELALKLSIKTAKSTGKQ